MRRGLKIAGISIGALLAVIALLLVIASAFDWNRIKPWVNDKVSEATGRAFAINGDLSFRWERPPEQQVGWRRFLPWPHIQAQDITLGNPEWARSGPYMARVKQIDTTINPLALLTKTISIRTLVIDGGNVALEKSKDDKNNWTFKKEENDQPSAWTFALHSLAIKNGNLRYVDPAKKADATASIDTSDDGTVNFKLGGIFNGEKVGGGGKAGGLLTLMERNVQYPVEATLKVGETTITADGRLTDPAHPTALDLKLKILGASMADLFPLSGLVLPETPKFSTEGRVIGSFKPDDIRVRYEKFQGRVGESDIAGTLEYLHRKPRPMLSGEVVSNQLRLTDLRALVGTDEEANKDDKEAKIPPGKVLPVSPFKTDRWGKMDVKVKFSGKKIVRDKALPIDNLETQVTMDNGVLALAPLNFGIAGGRLTTELNINGRDNPAKAKMKVSARGLRLKEMFPKAESMQASVGEVNGDASLSAAGNSFAALLGSANGEVKSLISQGSISKFVLEAAGLNIASAVAAKLFGDRQVELNCMAADFDVKSGVMQTRLFVIDTADATITADGNVNFKEETLNLTINPESKGVRIISLRSPLYVAGTFKEPDFGVNKGVVAAKAAAATVLGVAAAPAAALLALINPGPAEDSPCVALLKEAGEKPKAPPPGKKQAAK
ncbi:AsmA family protein [Noviherbaspirillum sp.]|uniref:AsmA family protein n=1 Tax=Noviherbaspirillum sp. TaxID=1926288 RepID=UPI002D2BE6D6|nr:AsmA family protein [Noviherbaspirillum sp.]HZW23582.1 AsmA family protein [Noviherbaspirillum sp.]